CEFGFPLSSSLLLLNHLSQQLFGPDPLPELPPPPDMPPPDGEGEEGGGVWGGKWGPLVAESGEGGEMVGVRTRRAWWLKYLELSQLTYSKHFR
ncbi:hypothetical protein Tco_0338668, partial [Tanacetum coccineum]